MWCPSLLLKIVWVFIACLFLFIINGYKNNYDTTATKQRHSNLESKQGGEEERTEQQHSAARKLDLDRLLSSGLGGILFLFFRNGNHGIWWTLLRFTLHTYAYLAACRLASLTVVLYKSPGRGFQILWFFIWGLSNIIGKYNVDVC